MVVTSEGHSYISLSVEGGRFVLTFSMMGAAGGRF